MDKNDQDDDNEGRWYVDEELTWKNYPSFDDVITDQNSTLLIAFNDYNESEKELKKIERWAKERYRNTEFVKDQYENEFVKIKSDKEIGSVFYVDNCIVIRFFDNGSKDEIIEHFNNEYLDTADYIIEVEHIEEKIKLKTGITAHIRTGINKKNKNWLPVSFWNLYQGRKHIAKALIGYHAGEICDCAPTILIFEVFQRFRRTGLGKKTVLGIEHYMWEYGFPKLRLENTKAISFWRSLDYDIDIDEGEKYLDYLDFE